MKRYAVLLLLLIPLVAYADEKPSIRFPSVVQPAPTPVPITPSKLTGDSLYCVDGDVPFFILASPSNLVTVSTKEGPLTIYGKFVDGSKYEFREYKSKTVSIVQAAGVGRCELIVIPQGATKEADVIRKTLDVDSGHAPQPPPEPTPDPKPPTPIPVAGFRVLMVFDKEKTDLPPAQVNILRGQEVRDYLNSKCAMGPDGKTRDWAIWPDKADASANKSEALKNAYARPRTSLPWIVISNGTAGYEGPLPATVAETMTLLRKFGG